MVFCARYSLQNNKYIPIQDKKRFIDSDSLYIKNSFLIKTMTNSIIPDFRNKNYYLKAKDIFNLYDTRELLGIE